MTHKIAAIFELARIVDCFQMPLLKRVKPAFSGERGRLPDGIPACVALDYQNN
jgi:hypothetical protein